jgi:hypothetical protein
MTLEPVVAGSEWAVPLADDLCDEYLRELDEEGLI